MSFRKGHAAFISLASSVSRLVRARGKTRLVQKRHARRRFIEQLEPRNLMALDIVSVTPADGANDWALTTNLTITFNSPVVKGQGNIHVVQSTTNTLGVAVDVNSTNVTIAGSTVTVDLPTDLLPAQAYYVLIDNGTFLETTAAPTNGATLLTQNFELLPLAPFDAGISGGDGTDYTLVPPLNYSLDNTAMPTGGLAPFRGWSFMDKNSWIAQAGDQARSAFTKGTGTVALGDPDQFDDATNGGAFNGKFISRPIQLTGVAPNSLVLEFDSSFRPEDSQIGTLAVRFDGGAWTDILTLNPANTSNNDPSPTVNPVNINEHLTSGINTGVSTGGTDNGKGNAPFRSIQNPAGATTMELRWGVVGQNDWWWAIDNVKVSGTLPSIPFLGVNSPTFWNLDIPFLTLSLDKTSMSENGGTATGTVTRNGSLTDPLTVNLVSIDTTEATVPATVVIPAMQVTASFPITAVNDLLADRTQTAVISASALPRFAPVSRSINVLDDEGPKMVTLSPPDNALGVDHRRNLSITFDVPVKKGTGLIDIVRTNGNLRVASIPVSSGAVTLSPSGLTATIDPPADLAGNTEYYVVMDDGVFVDLVSTAAPVKTILLTQNFDLLPLGPFTAPATGGDGTDFTKTAPIGFEVNPIGSGATGSGASDFNSWNFVDKNAWLATTGSGGRQSFTSGTGVVAVADAARWQATAVPAPQPLDVMNTFLTTRPIDLAASGVAANSVSLEFDVTYSAGLPRFGVVEVSYDGNTWLPLANFDNNSANTHVVINSSGVTGAGLLQISTLNNPLTGNMQFRFSLQNAAGGWLAIDNLQVFGGVSALTFQGITSPTDWNFTAVVPTLSVTIDKTSMSEIGGTAIGTVSRNASSDVDITVLLSSSDTTEATVPVSLVIPRDTGVFSGPVSITFPITAVDDALKDGPQVVVITGSTTLVPTFVSGTASIRVLDNELPRATTFGPADNATAVPVGANLVVTFTEDVKKGNGFVHIIRASDGKSAQSIDIQSSAVTISGAAVTINPPADLAGLSNYYVAFDNGAILNNLSTVIIDTPLLLQDFELSTLGPAVTETNGLTANGRDFTATPPAGYVVENNPIPPMPPGGVPEWNGWTFADKSFWQTQGGQGRSNFTKGQGTIAVGDTDEWDDLPQLNNSFHSMFITSPINLANVVANSVVLEFDSSFRPEGAQNPVLPTDNQIGFLEVTYDGGTNWAKLFTYDRTNTDGSSTAPNVNEQKFVNVPNPVASPTGSMMFRFDLTGTNDWWWALDNIKVTASTAGLAYPGIANTDATTWNFATAEASTLTLTAPVSPISEKGGIATVTVSRNLGTVGDLIVTLVSSDVALATVSTTVTIPDGQASATFEVTAVDELLADGLKNVMITASSAGFVNSIANVSIADNEVADVIISEFMYNPANGSSNTGVKREWIEVVNRGTVTADLGNWSIDDEDTTNWGKIAPGTLLAPGQVGILYNSVFGSITDTIFRTQWKVLPPATAVVVGMFWGDLGNTPSAVAAFNEIVLLRDAGNVVIDQVNYDDDGTIWPANTAGASIYLKNIYFNNDDGPNWGSTAVPPADGTTRGPDGGISPVGPTISVTDRGSPGVVPAFVPIKPSVFYNDAGFETSGTVSDALDTNKVLLRSSGTTQMTSFANVSNYTRGLNGAVIDVMGLTNTLTAADFTFRVAPAGASGVVDPITWADAPPPTVINTTAGTATTAGRIRLEWADNAIQNTWLQIIVKANARTGLSSPAVYYLGNALGDTNGAVGAGSPYRTGVPDLSAVQSAQSSSIVLVDNVLDVDKNRRVGVTDLSYVQARVSSSVLLNNIIIPVAGSAAEGSASTGGGSAAVRLSNSAAPPVFNSTFIDVVPNAERNVRVNEPTLPTKAGRIWEQSNQSALTKPEQRPVAFTKPESKSKIIENKLNEFEFLDKFFAKLQRQFNE